MKYYENISSHPCLLWWESNCPLLWMEDVRGQANEISFNWRDVRAIFNLKLLRSRLSVLTAHIFTSYLSILQLDSDLVCGVCWTTALYMLYYDHQVTYNPLLGGEEESHVNIVLVSSSLVKHQMFLLVKVCILNTEIWQLKCRFWRKARLRICKQLTSSCSYSRNFCVLSRLSLAGMIAWHY